MNEQIAPEAPSTGRFGKLIHFPAPARALASRGHRGYWLVTIVALVVIVITVAVWWSFEPNGTAHYTTVPVSQGAVTRAVTATGTVNPELTIIVGSYVSGVIQELYCDYNTQVKRGQVCAKIDPRPYQATLNQYSGQLLRDQAIRDKDRIDLVRYQSLAAQNAIAHQQAEDQAYVVQQDEATVKLDQGLVEGAKLNLEYTDIISPVDGTVVSRSVTMGQTVAATYQTPTLFLIASDLKKMEVDTNVSESDVGGLKEGNPATFTVDAYQKRTFEGQVSQVRQSPQTVQNVVTFDVVVSVDNTDLALKPGMTAATRIVTDQRTNVIKVPSQALRYTPGGIAANPAPQASATQGQVPAKAQAQVWVLKADKPTAVPVEAGLDDESFVEITDGNLKPGDLVIVSEQRQAAGGVPPPRL